MAGKPVLSGGASGGQRTADLGSSGGFAFVIDAAGSMKRVQGHGALSTNMHFYSAIIFILSSRGTSSKYIKPNQIKLIDFIETCGSCIQAHSQGHDPHEISTGLLK